MKIEKTEKKAEEVKKVWSDEVAAPTAEDPKLLWIAEKKALKE